jgi:two-component system sensor kinase
MLLVAAFRSEEVASDHPLRRLRPSIELKLKPFQAAELGQLVESMAGPLPKDALDLVERLSEGSPFMASAVLRGLVESRALVFDEPGWRLAASDDTPSVHSSLSAAIFLARRIGLLPASSLRLLIAGAVLGKEFDLSAAAKLAGQSAEEAIGALDEARRRHMVWMKGCESHCVFIHDKLREAFLGRLAEDERRVLHRRAALDLEARDPDAAFDLSYHFDAAGEYERALPFALAAAEKARSQYTLHIAEELCRIAERGAAARDRATRYRVVDALGDVLMLRGRYEEAGQKFRQAVELAEGDVDKAEIEGKLGELAFKQGDMKGATAANERALQMLGKRIPHGRRAFLLQFLVEGFIQVLHTLLPRAFLAKKSLVGAEKALLAAHLDIRLAYAYWFAGGRIPCLWAHLRSMNRLERYPLTTDLAYAYASHAAGMSLIGLFQRGLAYSRKSVAMYKTLGDLWGQALALNFRGTTLYAASRFEECIENNREAIRLLLRTGDVWEASLARYHVACSQFRLGDLTSAARGLESIYESVVELGDIVASGAMMDVWAQCVGGRLPTGVLPTELARVRTDTQVTAQLLIAEGVRLFWLDQEGEAAHYFGKAHQVAEAGGVRSSYVRPALPWLASALRRQAAKTAHLTPERRARLLEQAALAAKRALNVARTFQNELPHALREVGLVACMQGQARRGRRYLDESLAVASRQKARYEHAQTLLMRGIVGKELGWSRAEEDMEQARAALYELGAAFALGQGERDGDKTARNGHGEREVTLSLVDRFETLLEVGREIASALDETAILKAAEAATLRLLRAERCIVFQWSREAGRLIPLGSPPEKSFSKEMVQRAFDSEETVLFHELMTESASESLMLSGVRCALCVPFRIQDRVAGCFYLLHRQVGALFGDEEKRLAAFVATIVGVALENAERFKELQSLNLSLASERDKLRRAEAQLKDRLAELARSNRELEQVAYVASHDLRSPLRAIINWVQMLTMLIPEPRTKELDEALGFIQSNASKAIDLISAVMELARVDVAAFPVAKVDLNAVLDSTLKVLERDRERLNAEIRCEELPTVDGNATFLEAVFRNLIQNAFIYRDKSRILKIEIGFMDRIDFYEFFVKDNGIGIAAAQQEKIFQIFARAHSEQDYPAGVGIGLAFCKKVVELCRGRIWVESVVGAGSSFRFTYPKRMAEGVKR